MVATAQIGSILGPTIVNQYGATWGPARCYMVGAVCMLLLQGTMYMYIRIYGGNQEGTTSSSKKKKQTRKVIVPSKNPESASNHRLPHPTTFVRIQCERGGVALRNVVAEQFVR